MATWDAEVGNVFVVEDVPLQSSLEGFLVLEDAVLKPFDLLCKAMELHRSVSFSVGDRGEEAVRNGVKEYRVDIVICGKS